jgi:hypothetical protein
LRGDDDQVCAVRDDQSSAQQVCEMHDDHACAVRDDQVRRVRDDQVRTVRHDRVLHAVRRPSCAAKEMLSLLTGDSPRAGVTPFEARA